MFRTTKDQPTNFQAVLMLTGLMVALVGCAFTPHFESLPMCLLGMIGILAGTWRVRNMGPMRFLSTYGGLFCVGQYFYVFSEAFGIPLVIFWTVFLGVASFALIMSELKKRPALPTLVLAAIRN